MSSAVSRLQTNTGSISSTTSGTVSMGNTTTGNTIVVIVVTDASGSSVTSITDSQSNSYSKIDGVAWSVGFDSLEAWQASSITGGALPTITVNLSASDSAILLAREYSGLNGLDTHVIATGSGSALTSGATSNTTTRTLVIGYSGQSATSGSPTAGSGFVNLSVATSGTVKLAIEDKIVTGQGPQTATFTGSGLGYACGVANFIIPNPGFTVNNLRPHPFSPGLAR